MIDDIQKNLRSLFYMLSFLKRKLDLDTEAQKVSEASNIAQSTIQPNSRVTLANMLTTVN